MAVEVLTDEHIICQFVLSVFSNEKSARVLRYMNIKS